MLPLGPGARRRARGGRPPHRRRGASLMADRNTAGGPEGILVVDKPIGPTSHDVVAIVRRLSGVRRVGHGGTLDPFAAGVLPVFLGRATRMVEYHLGDEKAYRAVMVFGARSTTDDLDGELTPIEGAAAQPGCGRGRAGRARRRHRADAADLFRGAHRWSARVRPGASRRGPGAQVADRDHPCHRCRRLGCRRPGPAGGDRRAALLRGHLCARHRA